MMYEKIIKIYPDLANYDFGTGSIRLQNDSDGRVDYIAEWNHPTYKKPTDEELA